MTSSAQASPSSLIVRQAVPADVGALARLHRQAFPSGVQTRLGSRFLRLLYLALVEDPAVVLIVGTRGRDPIAFVVGYVSSRSFHRRFLLRYGPRVFPIVVRRVFGLDPVRMLRSMTTNRRTAPPGTGEVHSMVVAPEEQGRGVATRIGEALVSALSDRGVRQVLFTITPETRVVAGMGERRGSMPVAHRVGHEGQELHSFLLSLPIPIRSQPVGSAGEPVIRPAHQGDVDALALLHLRELPGALASLGPRFIRLLYEAAVRDRDTVVLVADREGKVIGSVMGIRSRRAFVARLAIRHGAPATLIVASRFRWVVRLLLRNRRTSSTPRLPKAEIHNWIVSPEARGLGVGTALGRGLQAELAGRGIREARGTVEARNEPINRILVRLGGRRVAQSTSVSGEPVNVYEVPCPPPSRNYRRATAIR